MKRVIFGLFFIFGVVSGRSFDTVFAKGSKSLDPKDINQWNIIQVGQQGEQSQQGVQSPAPSFVWVQVPVGNLAVFGNTQISQSETQNTGLQIDPTGPNLVVEPVDNLNKLCLKPNGQFPSKSCKKFINCWKGVGTEQDCPEGLVFNPKGFCDYPGSVNCDGKPTEGSTNIDLISVSVISTSPTSSSSPPDQPITTTTPTVATLPPVDPSLKELCLNPRGQFPSKSCKKYVNCWDDIVTEEECPEGLLFSTKGYCDYPENVDCGDKRTHIENKECSVQYGTFRDLKNCNKYYTCASFKIVAQHDCPPGFNFNDDIGICDYSHNVDCDKKPKIYQITSKSILQVPEEFRERVNSCRPGTIFRLNSQCSMACLCRQGLAEIVQCPSGFAYDSSTDKCVLSHLARC